MVMKPEPCTLLYFDMETGRDAIDAYPDIIVDFSVWTSSMSALELQADGAIHPFMMYGIAKASTGDVITGFVKTVGL